MAEPKYEKHFIRHPKVLDWLPHHGDPKPAPGEKGMQHHVIFIDSELMPKAHKHVMINWFTGKARTGIAEGMLEEQRGVPQHQHPHDELLLIIGTNPDDYDDLGGMELEMCMGPEQEKHVINTTTAIYIPAGMLHCPLKWTKIGKPHLLVVVSMGDAYK